MFGRNILSVAVANPIPSYNRESVTKPHPAITLTVSISNVSCLSTDNRGQFPRENVQEECLASSRLTGMYNSSFFIIFIYLKHNIR